MGKIADRFTQRGNKVHQPRLLNAYWGYHPRGTKRRSPSEIVDFLAGRSQHSDDDHGCFEFSTMHLSAMVSKEVALEVTQYFYQAVRDQLQHYHQMTPLEQQDFLDEEEDRLRAVITDLDINGRSHRPMEHMMHLNIVACCAISTMVAGGRLQQDDLNGDAFMWQQ